MPFHKTVALTTEMAAVLAILLFLHATAGIGRATLGLGSAPRDLRRGLPIAFIAGALFLAALEGLLLLLGIHSPAASADWSASSLARLLFVALVMGLLVAAIEETLFRGALFSGLARSAGVVAALVLSSAVYAAVHFVKFKPMRPGVDLDWSTGPALLAQGLTRFSNPIIIDSFLTLFALGVLLGLMRLARGHIAECIGFHAGVVAGLRVAGKLTDYTPGSRFDFLVNRWNPELGWLAFFCVAAAIAAYCALFMGRAKSA
jgi:membrane protease YdiL (CAAX protease family)